MQKTLHKYYISVSIYISVLKLNVYETKLDFHIPKWLLLTIKHRTVNALE